MDHTELKQSDSSESLPQFHLYDAVKIRTEETLRSIVVTDIPLFLKLNEVKSRFAQHGTIQKFSMTTPPNSMYQKALVTYTDPDVVKRWETIWISWCKCQCLRVAPAYHTKEQHDSRFQYTAVLRNIPFGLDGMDLANIFKETNAAAMNLPRNCRSYNNKPWCHFFFKN